MSGFGNYVCKFGVSTNKTNGITVKTDICVYLGDFLFSFFLFLIFDGSCQRPKLKISILEKTSLTILIKFCKILKVVVNLIKS